MKTMETLLNCARSLRTEWAIRKALRYIQILLEEEAVRGGSGRRDHTPD